MTAVVLLHRIVTNVVVVEGVTIIIVAHVLLRVLNGDVVVLVPGRLRDTAVAVLLVIVVIMIMTRIVVLGTIVVNAVRTVIGDAVVRIVIIVEIVIVGIVREGDC